jgi:hypothetical protein
MSGLVKCIVKNPVPGARRAGFRLPLQTLFYTDCNSVSRVIGSKADANTLLTDILAPQ